MRTTKKLALYRSSATSIAQQQPSPDIEQLAIVHVDSLSSMKGIENLTKLRKANLSCNSIKVIQGLSPLANSLKQLNLSNNKIHSLSGIEDLHALEVLLVFHNFVEDLSPLHTMSKNGNTVLRVLDLKNNKISREESIKCLAGFDRLTEVIFEQGKFTNPVCSANHTRYYLLLKRLLPQFNRIKLIDGKSPAEIERQIRDTTRGRPQQPIQPSIQDQQEYDGEHSQYDQKQNSAYRNSHSRSENIYVQDNYTRKPDANNQMRVPRGQQHSPHQDRMEHQFHEMERVLQFKDKIIEELEQRCVKLQDSNQQLYREVLRKDQDIEKMQSILKEQDRRLQQKQQQLQQANKQLTQIIKENSGHNREIAIKNKQLEKYVMEISELKQQLGEAKAVLRDNQKRMLDFNTKVIENVNSNTIRNEEMKRKYQALLEQNKTLSKEHSDMKHRILELTDLCREMEFKQERKLDQLSYEHNDEKKLLAKEYQRKMDEQQGHYEDILNKERQEYKEQMDLVEESYKAAIVEISDKYKETKKMLDECLRREKDDKSMLKVALDNNIEKENLIQELQEAMIQFRKQLEAIVREKEQLNAEINTMRTTKAQQIKTLTEERDRATSDKAYLERQYADIKDKYTVVRNEYERDMVNRKKIEELERVVEELTATVETKNAMLDDKNDTIENHKQEIRDRLQEKDQEIEERNQECAALRKKYEKCKKEVHEMQELTQTLQEDNQKMNKEIEELSAALQEKQEQEKQVEESLVELDERFKQKESEVEELLDLLEKCKAEYKKKTDELERERRQYTEKMDVLRGRERVSKAEIDNLKESLRKLEGEKKAAEQEFETQRQMFKETADKFAKMFR